MAAEDVCRTEEFTEKKLRDMPDDDTIMELSDLFKLFGDSTRLRILLALKDGGMCVETLSSIVGVSVSAVSHQLKSLKTANLVRSKRDGKWVHYELCDEHIEMLLNIAMEHLREGPE